MNGLRQDLRYGFRALTKSPGFTLIAILTLALGIGANTAIFSVVNAVLLRPLPYGEPERIVQLWETQPSKNAYQGTVSPLCFNDWRTRSRSFASMAAYRYANFTLTGGDTPQSLTGASVSADFLAVIGVAPARGRGFTPEDDQPGNSRSVVLSHGLWQRRFASDPQIIGRTLELNGENQTVIGVMPPGFEFPNSVELWSPLALDLPRLQRGSHYLFAIGRLKPGIVASAAQTEMDAIARDLEREYPDDNRGIGVNVVSLHDQLVKETRSALLVLLGAVTLVLLIACVNVANLLLVRATGRQREIAIRSALGASRWQIIRQLLTEGMLLAVLGGALGLLLAWWGVDLLKKFEPGNLPRTSEIGVDPWTLAFTFLIAIITGIVSAAVPAIYATNPDLNQALKESGQQSGGMVRGSVRGILVIAEVALTIVLLVGAGLLINTFLKLQRVDPGFRAENVMTMYLSLPRARYREGAQQVDFFTRAVDSIRAVPGVAAVGVVSDLPFSGSRSVSSFEIEGRDQTEDFAADQRVVSGGYFHVMSMPLLAGRDFTERDRRESTGVIIINQTMARRFFPNENPLGKRLRIGGPIERGFYGGTVPWREVVGVVGDIKHRNLQSNNLSEMYVPFAQYPMPGLMVAVRGTGDSNELVAGIRRTIAEIDRNQPVSNVRLMESRLASSIRPQRFNMLLLGLFAGLALALAAVGLYGVMSYSVARNTREIGIRMALGAEPSHLLRLVIGQGLSLTLIGTAIGLAGAFGLTRLMTSLVYGVKVSDPLTFVGSALVLLLVSLFACYLPARRATKINPIIALRNE
jgi:putative ABC transport system permease protein